MEDKSKNIPTCGLSTGRVWVDDLFEPKLDSQIKSEDGDVINEYVFPFLYDFVPINPKALVSPFPLPGDASSPKSIHQRRFEEFEAALAAEGRKQARERKKNVKKSRRRIAKKSKAINRR